MNKDELDGKVDQVKGKIKQGAGDMTGNERLPAAPIRRTSPSLSMASDMAAACRPSKKVHSSARLRTRGRALSASCCAISPPIECPARWKRSSTGCARLRSAESACLDCI